MGSIRYRRGGQFAADMAAYTREFSQDNAADIGRLKRNLLHALKDDVTRRQREMLTMYYFEGRNMREIGVQLGVDKSTVSRTIKRGEHNLKRCLRYGASYLLKEPEE